MPNNPTGGTPMGPVETLPDVLTLEEAADYLRLPRETVELQAAAGQLPCRRINQDWRFLKAALDDWLRGQDVPVTPPRSVGVVVHAREGEALPYDGRATLLQQAGRFADDPTLMPMLKEIYSKRGRPEVEQEPSP
jgi:excisionase family DNA binding protein